MDMIDWVKPSGLEITTNDEPATIEYCESLDWVREDDGELTLEKIEGMSGKALKALIEEYELDVAKSGSVADMRVAVIEALEPAKTDDE